MNSIKVTIENETGKSEIDYPCLMIAKAGDIVLFSDEGVGALIYKVHDSVNYRRKIGYVSESWNMPGFAKFKGKVVMEGI